MALSIEWTIVTIKEIYCLRYIVLLHKEYCTSVISLNFCSALIDIDIVYTSFYIYGQQYPIGSNTKMLFNANSLLILGIKIRFTPKLMNIQSHDTFFRFLLEQRECLLHVCVYIVRH